MRLQSSLSSSVAPYSGNESITVNKAVKFFGRARYTWNARFVLLIDAFFLGTPIESTTRNTLVPLSKFVAYANGTLPTTDLDYDMLAQYNEYLATL